MNLHVAEHKKEEIRNDSGSVRGGQGSETVNNKGADLEHVVLFLDRVDVDGDGFEARDDAFDVGQPRRHLVPELLVRRALFGLRPPHPLLLVEEAQELAPARLDRLQNRGLGVRLGRLQKIGSHHAGNTTLYPICIPHNVHELYKPLTC